MFSCNNKTESYIYLALCNMFVLLNPKSSCRLSFLLDTVPISYPFRTQLLTFLRALGYT